MVRTGAVADTEEARARPSPRRSTRPTSSCSPAASRSDRTTTSSRRSKALGVDEVFWRVALRPGRPTWFGTRDGTLVFGLPGNPVSAMVTFMLFARPALGAHAGRAAEPERIVAHLAEAIPRHPDRDECARVRAARRPGRR